MQDFEAIRKEVKYRIIFSWFICIFLTVIVIYLGLQKNNFYMITHFKMSKEIIVSVISFSFFIIFSRLLCSTLSTKKLKDQLNFDYKSSYLIPCYKQFFDDVSYTISSKQIADINKSKLIEVGEAFSQTDIINFKYLETKICKSNVFSSNYRLSHLGAIIEDEFFSGRFIIVSKLNFKDTDICIFSKKMKVNKKFKGNSFNLNTDYQPYKIYTESKDLQHNQVIQDALDELNSKLQFAVHIKGDKAYIALQDIIYLGVPSYFRKIDFNKNENYIKDIKDTQSMIKLLKTLETIL